MSDKVLRLINSKSDDLVLYFEPWAEELIVGPGVTVVLRHATTNQWVPELELMDQGVTFHGYVSSKVIAEINDEIIWESN